ncbi:MAG TPA: single-stranded-DNA-specific exonuclease RecJ [Gemmataceae bacterium]|nr:single-stranded-DNA-specific exonuclease RecJ [Gemmataceae bacterium]
MANTVKTWHLLPHDDLAIERLARSLGVSVIVAQLLLNRNLTTPDAAVHFLKAPLTGLHDPLRLPGVKQAAERILSAAKQGRRICVYGDYDVDGVTGTAVLIHVLRLLGADAEFHVPNRLEDGYGVKVEALKRIAEGGAKLVVTVDCGIASIEEAEEARRLGLELIVTDHHEPKERLPAADVLVHPRLPEGAYPFGSLAGSGVAFKVAWALCQLASGSDKVSPAYRECLLNAVALVAMGTVADVVPLREENRIFVRHGLVRLQQGPSEGLKALLSAAGLDGKPLSATDIGYGLAPRLNAAGRLGSARLAVELLTTTSPQRAADLARFLEEQNQKRQAVERGIYSSAREQAERYNAAGAPALVLSSTGWHAGMIGIVAGRLMDAFARPVLMIALGENGAPGAGSGRSVPGFKLHEALRECSEHLLSHGGHATAAGFKIAAPAVDAFRESFCSVAARHFTAGPPSPRVLIDAEVPLSALTPGLIESMKQLEPYGAGNPQPLFLAGDLQVVGEPRRVGGGERHLSFKVRQQSREMKAIAFGMGERLEELVAAEGKCSLVFTPRINEWQGWRSVELEVKDLQAGSRARLE